MKSTTSLFELPFQWNWLPEQLLNGTWKHQEGYQGCSVMKREKQRSRQTICLSSFGKLCFLCHFFSPRCQFFEHSIWNSTPICPPKLLKGTSSLSSSKRQLALSQWTALSIPIYQYLAHSGMTVCTPEAHTGTDLKNSASHWNYYFKVRGPTKYKKEQLGQMIEMTLWNWQGRLARWMLFYFQWRTPLSRSG